MREGELRKPKGEGSLHAVFSSVNTYGHVRTSNCSTRYSIFIEFEFIELIKVQLLGYARAIPSAVIDILDLPRPPWNQFLVNIHWSLNIFIQNWSLLQSLRQSLHTRSYATNAIQFSISGNYQVYWGVGYASSAVKLLRRHCHTWCYDMQPTPHKNLSSLGWTVPVLLDIRSDSVWKFTGVSRKGSTCKSVLDCDHQVLERFQF